MAQWNTNSGECTHQTTETSEAIVYDHNEDEIDRIPVKTCSECQEIQDMIEEEDNYYQLPRESNDCDHPHDGVEVIHYNFKFEDGTQIWDTVTRVCTKCGILIERVNVDLTGKP